MQIGTPVKTTQYTTIFSAAGSTSTQGHQQAGATGKINAGPTVVSGVTWWKVDFAVNPDGWLKEQYLIDTSLTPPVNTVAPVLTGGVNVGDILTLTPGTWTGNPAPTISYLWSWPYVLTMADVGVMVTATETGTNSQGSVDAVSNAIGPVVNPVPAGKFIRPVAHGAADGSSWENAGALPQLASFMAQSPGGTVYIRADEGRYASFNGVSVSCQNVTVQGCNGDYTPGYPQIDGDRDPWTLPADPEQVTSVAGWNTAGNFVKLLDGAANLTFRYLNLTRFGDTFYADMPNTYLDGLVIEDCKGYNVRRYCEQTADSKGVINSRFENIEVIGFSKTCFRLQNDSHDVLYRNVHANSGRQDRDNFAMCFQGNSNTGFSIAPHDITYDHCTAENCHSTSAGTGYAQGDGFVAEYGCERFTWIDCVSHGHTDGGWDFKGSGHVLRRCESYDNKRNLRNWAIGTQVLGCTLQHANRRYGGGSQREVWCGSTDAMWTAGTLARVVLSPDLETGQHCQIIDSPSTAVCETSKGKIEIYNTDITKPAANLMNFAASSGGSFYMDAYTTSHVVNI